MLKSQGMIDEKDFFPGEQEFDSICSFIVLDIFFI